MTPMRRRPDGCLSEFALERRRAREMDAEERARVDAHLGTCERCRALEVELADGRAEFARRGPPLAVVRPPRRLVRAWFGGLAATLAVAAAMFLYVDSTVVIIARPKPHQVEETRSKGATSAFGFYVNHGGAVRRGGVGEHVAPGDALRFVTTTEEERWLAVLSVDGRGQASVYWPEAPETARVEVGKEIGLPGSTVLDDVVGHETIYGVFCARPMPIEPLRRALELTPTRPPLPEGCTVETVSFDKP